MDVSTIGKIPDEQEPEPFSDSGSEYIPSDQSASESAGDYDTENDVISEETSCKTTKPSSRHSEYDITSSTDKSKPKTKNGSRQLSSTEQVTSTSSGFSNKKITINYSAKKNNKRFRNKYHACYFCHKLIQNVARHFEVKHSGELEIIEISSFPKKSLKRRKAYGELIKAGDFYHNCEVLSSRTGELILVRRPTEAELLGVTYSDYGPCPKCLGFLLKRHLWHHVKYTCGKASNEHDDKDSKKSKFVITESSSLMNGVLQTDFPENFLTNIVDKLRSDEIGTVIRNDTLILRFGAFLYEKYGDTQLELIRQNMRQLSRLLLELNKLSPTIKSISDSLNPEKFDLVIEATKKLTLRSEGAIVSRPTFEIPSLALKIGYALKKCIGIERGQALRHSNIRRDKSLKSFEKLLLLEWNVRISSNALASLHSKKLNNTELLPITSDLLILSKFLEKEIKSTREELEQNCSTSLWTTLASLTLTRIVLFNKRRSGEAARMTVQQYSSRPEWNASGTETVKKALSPFEQELAKTLVLVNIVGKRGRHVPVILTGEMIEAIDLLIKLRTKVDIVPENPFLFALGGNSLRHIRGHDALKKWCTEANLQSPELITGTKIRKYIATVCQVFNLTENQTDWLARHLGHDIRVHREFYRLHDNAVELAKVSRLLIAVDQGQAEKFAGKTLDEINVAGVLLIN